jgi:formylglycine-generating enzyme required for sulfatase activity
MRHEKYDWRRSASRWRQILWHGGTLTLGLTLVVLVLAGAELLPHLVVSSIGESMQPQPKASLPPIIYPLHVSFAAQMIFVEIQPETVRWESLDPADRKPGRQPPSRPRPFYLGKFEVTQVQWRQVMGTDPSVFKGDDLPVENVSWNDCQAFCKKLCELEKVPAGTYRLPTVAERDWVCQYGLSTSLPVSSAASAWIGGNSGGSTHPIGGKPCNAWGVFDLGGNVWEWCSDPAGDDPAAAEPVRIFCGGGWDSSGTVSPRTRCTGNPSARMNTVGFRVVFASQSPAGD